jgi:DNA-binding response OmpR family regulator
VELVAGGRALVDRLLGAPAAAAEPPALAAFALGLPDLHGFHVLRELRAVGERRPDARIGAVVTTECGDEAHRVRALRLGADDVLTRPFGVTEFVARVDAVLRRTLAPRDIPAADHPGPGSDAPGGDARARTAAGRRLRFGDTEVDVAARAVWRRGAPVALVPKEFDLLVALLRRDGAVASRAALLAEVWGYDRSVTSRTVDGHLAKLRRKLEDDPQAPRHLLTVSKAGYRLQP